MSKTVLNIGIIAAAVAINVIPGAQAFSAGIISSVGIAGGTAAFAAAGTLASSLAIAGGLTALQFGASVLAKSPRPEQSVSAIRTEIPPRVSGYGRYKTYGAQLLYDTASDGAAVDVFAFHDGRIDGIEAYYLGDDPIALTPAGFVVKGEDGRYGDSDTIQVKVSLGAAVGTAWSEVIAKLPSIWTANHRGDGVVTGFMISNAVKAKNYQEVYPTGGPNQTPLAIVIRAQPVFDWRDGTQSLTDPLTWKWSENAILHLAHYQLVRNGKTWVRHFAPTLSYWTAAANDADVAMPLKAGGTEPRYRSCVSHKHTEVHKAVIGSLIACCDGWMAPREDGALIIYSGRYYAPTVTIGPDEIVSYSWDHGIEDENALNEVPVSYVSSAHDFNSVDATAWIDEDDVAARGQVRSDPLANQVPSHAQARRLAKRRMAQVMAPSRGTVTTTSDGKAVVGQRFIWLHQAEAVGTDDEFTTYTGPAEITQLRRNLQTGAVSFSWIAANPAIDAWNPATEEGEPAPVGDRVAREPLDAPIVATTVASYAQDSGAGAAGVRIIFSIDGGTRTDVTWYARWRVVGAVSWNEQEYSDIDAGPMVVLQTGFVPVDAMVESAAAYGVGDGRISPWSTTVTVNTSTAALAPEPTTDMSAAGGAGAITATWRNPASTNYSYTRAYYGTTSVFSAATALSPDDAASPLAVRSVSYGSIAPGAYYVWTRAFSSAGIPSTPTMATGTVTVT